MSRSNRNQQNNQDAFQGLDNLRVKKLERVFKQFKDNIVKNINRGTDFLDLCYFEFYIPKFHNKRSNLFIQDPELRSCIDTISKKVSDLIQKNPKRFPQDLLKLRDHFINFKPSKLNFSNINDGFESIVRNFNLIHDAISHLKGWQDWKGIFIQKIISDLKQCPKRPDFKNLLDKFLLLQAENVIGKNKVAYDEKKSDKNIVSGILQRFFARPELPASAPVNFVPKQQITEVKNESLQDQKKIVSEPPVTEPSAPDLNARDSAQLEGVIDDQSLEGQAINKPPASAPTVVKVAAPQSAPPGGPAVSVDAQEIALGKKVQQMPKPPTAKNLEEKQRTERKVITTVAEEGDSSSQVINPLFKSKI